MEIKESLYKSQGEDRMLEDSDYFRYIFKKTEKMVCAVFYILRQDSYQGQNDTVIVQVELSAMKLLDTALQSLQGRRNTIEHHATELQHALIVYESNLRVASASRHLSTELLDVFVHEIDSVHRMLKRYIEPVSVNPLSEITGDVLKDRRPTRSRTVFPKHGTEHAQTLVTAIAPDRRERVLNVLRDKGEATIKDIVSVVTDCSEKTIQRELISLIKDNIIVREGERRWSRYKIL